MIIQHTNFGAQSVLRYGIHEGRYNYGNHLHQFSEFVFVLDGELKMTVEGNRESGKKGDVFFVSPFKVHNFETEEYCKILIFVFSNDFASSLIGEEILYKGRDSALFTPSQEAASYVNSRLIDAARNFCYHEAKGEYYRQVTCCIHVLIDEYMKSTTLSDNKKKSNSLGAIFLHIAQHYREKITLESLSSSLGYTKGHISHCLESIPNFNFTDLVNSMRIEYAKNIMLTTHYRNIDLALEAGFSSERSFHRSFKKYTGMTPGEYIKSKREIKQ